MRAKEYYESVAKEIGFSTVNVNEETRFVSFHTDIIFFRKDEMEKIMAMVDGCVDYNCNMHKGFNLNIHF